MFSVFFKTLLIATTFVNSLQKEHVRETKSKPRVSGNAIVDTIVQHIISDEIGLKRFSVVPIPDLEKELETNWVVMQVRTSLKATGGTLTGLKSLRRISNVTNRTVGNTTYFTVAVTLDDLHLTFTHYRLNFGVFHKTGNRLALNVGTNSFIATFKSHVDGPNCQLTLDDLKVNGLSEMKVDLSGLYFSGHIVTMFKDYLYNVIDEITETHWKDMVNYVIKDKKICEELFEDEIADHGTPEPSLIGTKPFHQIETLSTKPVHDRVRTSEGYPVSTKPVHDRVRTSEGYPVSTKPVHDRVRTSAVHDRVRTSEGYPVSTNFTLWRVTVPTSQESSKKTHPITEVHRDKTTKRFPEAEESTITTQVSSQNTPSESPDADILQMIDNIPSMVYT